LRQTSNALLGVRQLVAWLGLQIVLVHENIARRSSLRDGKPPRIIRSYRKR